MRERVLQRGERAAGRRDPHGAQVGAPAVPAETGTGARERLLEAAAALIVETQSIDISLAEIAGRAGLNSALVKYYFGGKMGLLVALLRRDAEQALAEMAALLEAELPPEQAMRRHLRGIMAAYRRSPYLNRLMVALLRHEDEAVRAQARRMLVQPVFTLQRRVLDAGVAAGVFRRVDHRAFYLSAVGACDQFMQTESVLMLEQDGIALEEFRDRYIAHVVEMVMASLVPGVGAG